MKLLFKCLTIIALVVATSSCTKDTSENGDVSQTPNALPKAAISFDKFGISHNLAMDYVAGAPNFDNRVTHLDVET